MEKIWTPGERARCALTLGKPDEIPTFELEFQLSEEMFGYPLWDRRFDGDVFPTLSSTEVERAAYDLADKYARVYGCGSAYDIGGPAISGDPDKDARPGLDYAIIPVYSPWWWDVNSPVTIAFRRRLREHFGNTRLFGGHGDGTFAIPSGSDMYSFAYRIADEPEEVLAEAERMCQNADGMLMIKHTDGNIMPIIGSLVEAGPNALHSIDPMAGVDIHEVKRLYGDKVALCGNVHCAALQTGTDDEVRASAEYCLKYGGEGGGYIFATSNIPFKGMPPERYDMILDIWKAHRKYE